MVQQIRLEADLLSPDSQSPADHVSVEIDGPRGEFHDGADLLGAPPLFDEIRNLKFRGGQVCFRFYPAQEGRGQGVEIVLEALDQRFRLIR